MFTAGPATAAATARRHALGAGSILLAVGDSLAAGYQPTDGHRPPPIDPATGMPDAGYPGGYAADIARAKHLRLIDLGCPGETTLSYVSRPAQKACASGYEELTHTSNQQAAALAELAAHKGQVSLVTFDLGMNDLDGCLHNESVSLSCLGGRATALARRLPRLIGTLKAALQRDDPGAVMVAMTYYDPFLAQAYRPGGLKGDALAALSLSAATGLDATLAALYRHLGLLVAPVGSAFRLGTVLPLRTYGGKTLPTDVAQVCTLTWMCPLPGATRGANVHPNTHGYAVIADEFERALARAGD